jgi:hypothetical protein
MGTEKILIDRERRTWFYFGKLWEDANAAKEANPGSEIVYDDEYDDWYDWQWDELTFAGCAYVCHSGCSHGPIPESQDWPKAPAEVPLELREQ